MRALLLILGTVLAVACSADVPEGRLRCVTADDCPSGWFCRTNEAAAELRCYSTATGMDGGPLDGGGVDGGGFDASLPDAGPPPCDDMEMPDEATGVFVLAGATGGDGSRTSPLGTIAAALPIARTGRPNIYVGNGRYPEALALDAPPPGLVIDGGWNVTGIWTRDCETGREATLIASPEAVGMRITDATGGVTLRHLTIETSPPGTPSAGAAGGSRIALLVAGANSAVSLYDVHLRARDGEPGGAAGEGAVGAMPACGGLSCSDGGGGGSGSRGPDATPGGTFDATGFTQASGEPGTMGSPGHDGAAGGAAYRAATNCCGLCNGGGGCSTVCNATADVPQGRCGCGGQPGEPGAGGPGGGASVGLLVLGMDAVVSSMWTFVETGNGGAGAPGGAPGDPSAPTAGTMGMAECCTFCRVESACPACSCYREMCMTHTSTAGTMGGPAGASGVGGGGAGGPSYAVVTVDGARYLGDATSALLHRAGGAGGGADNAGASADTYTP
jgi:hypothetical protein